MTELDIITALGDMSTSVLLFFAWRSQMTADQQHIERLITAVERMACDRLQTAPADQQENPAKRIVGGAGGAVVSLLIALSLIARFASLAA